MLNITYALDRVPPRHAGESNCGACTALNDGREFAQQDLESICALGNSAKRDMHGVPLASFCSRCIPSALHVCNCMFPAGVLGTGTGFSACFHLCDLCSLLSGQSLVLFDPLHAAKEQVRLPALAVHQRNTPSVTPKYVKALNEDRWNSSCLACRRPWACSLTCPQSTCRPTPSPERFGKGMPCLVVSCRRALSMAHCSGFPSVPRQARSPSRYAPCCSLFKSFSI